MARIAVGGFQHETNCFVPTRTDYEYFAAHRDRPPLVRGAAVLEWLGETSFALSGFLREMGLRSARPAGLPSASTWRSTTWARTSSIRFRCISRNATRASGAAPDPSRLPSARRRPA